MKLWNLFCAFLIGLIFIPAHAQEVAVNIKLNSTERNGIWIDVEVKNVSKKIVDCLNGAILGLAGEISNPIFVVRHKDKIARYTGSFDLHNPQSIPFVKILPGHAIMTSVEIENLYDFSLKGQYDIQLDFQSAGFCNGEPHIYKLKSNSVVFVKR